MPRPRCSAATRSRAPTGAGKDAAQTPPHELAREEDYWSQIQRAFDVDRTLINFNNGGVAPWPTHVLDQMIRDLRFSNELPALHMWSVLEPRVESVRRDLAREFGCDPEELAITRNASEGMETLILGIDLKRGDEVIVTDQNYGRMLTTWDQRARREGIVVKSVSFKVPLPSTDALRRPDSAARSRRGPASSSSPTSSTSPGRSCRCARSWSWPARWASRSSSTAPTRSPTSRSPATSCDATTSPRSLHKWLLAPIGTGFLYVRKAKIKSIWPLMAASAGQSEDIRKYEEIGTHPAANHNAIAAALAFHRSIGDERKAARLRYLRNRWAKPLLAASHRVKVWTPLDDDSASCGITLVNIEGIDPGKLGDHLMDKHGILVTPIVHKDFQGIRVTPNIYATLEEIDIFGELMQRVVAKGLS